MVGYSRDQKNHPGPVDMEEVIPVSPKKWLIFVSIQYYFTYLELIVLNMAIWILRKPKQKNIKPQWFGYVSCYSYPVLSIVTIVHRYMYIYIHSYYGILLHLSYAYPKSLRRPPSCQAATSRPIPHGSTKQAVPPCLRPRRFFGSIIGNKRVGFMRKNHELTSKNHDFMSKNYRYNKALNIVNYR